MTLMLVVIQIEHEVCEYCWCSVKTDVGEQFEITNLNSEAGEFRVSVADSCTVLQC